MVEKAFKELGRTEKSKFISRNIEYANAGAIANYVRSYLFDVLKELKDDEYVAEYLKMRGYEVIKKDSKGD